MERFMSRATMNVSGSSTVWYRFTAPKTGELRIESAGNWDFRLGRQHVVWGEMVGLYFADVVSARDQREFILPDFDQMRTPQWAGRAEYFSDDFHAEILWIPVATSSGSAAFPETRSR